MRKNKIRVGSVILGALLSFTLVSCDKEQLETVNEAERIEVDDKNDCNTQEVALSIEGTWNWELTETAAGVITPEESGVTKKVYFTEDKAYFYTDNKIEKTKSYQLYNGTGVFEAEAIILVLQGDDYTYEVSVNDEDILTISTQDCADRTLTKYRKK